MPSLSTTSDANPRLPPASVATTSKCKAPPAVTGRTIGTVARHVPACAVPADVAATPFTVTAVTPTTSLVCTITSAAPLVNMVSVDGDAICTTGAVVSTTSTEKPPAALLPAPSVALQLTAVAPIGNPLPDA